MPRITNSDQVAHLLRSQLQRMDKVRKRTPTAKSAEVTKVDALPLERVQAMAQDEVLSDEEIQRALISGILTEEFGPAIANDPEFQKVIDSVLAAVKQDEQTLSLLQSSVSQLTDNA